VRSNIIDIDDICLCPTCPPIHRKARWLDHVDFDAASVKETRQPKSVAPSFMGEYDPADLGTRRRALGL
jgi:hypothetical protein